jgi:hypothetical protein
VAQYSCYFSFLYCPAAAQAGAQWLNSRAKKNDYVDKEEVGKPRTARGKTSQILGPRHAKVLLASGEVTSDDDKDLAMALSSGSKNLDDRIWELAARLMDEARKDPEPVIVQDPDLSTRLLSCCRNHCSTQSLGLSWSESYIRL